MPKPTLPQSVPTYRMRSCFGAVGLAWGLGIAALGLSACASRAPATLSESVPQGSAIPDQLGPADGPVATLSPTAWRDIVTDPRLVQLVEQALQNNLDLRTAALNIDAARASYRISEANQLPTLNASASVTRSATGDASPTNRYNVSLGLASWEIDLWGRLGQLKAAALASYMATEETKASVQTTLITEVVQAWLTLAADQSLARLSQETLAARQSTLELTQRKVDLGAASQLDWATARASVETARASLASAQSQVEQDRNALRLLLGSEPAAKLLPTDHEDTQLVALPPVPANLASTVLLRRPDVRSAERSLQAQQANLAAARAALLPTISLTSSIGQSSSTLEDLMKDSARTWSIAPSISLPIFDGGTSRANVQAADVKQQLALTSYQKTLQNAFQETADALAVRRHLGERLAAQQAQVQAYETVLRLTEKQRELGAASTAAVLTAQLNLFSAQQSLISLRLTEQSNRLTLYKVMGGV
ncbi:efflux transporter outer membrane subunit [Curvibacter sp. CHRR-16]|uniref:efflux transporter outer membrane subunit n=1 Tax=Curvibacter sp. CHRR-16 TaxID=2835872 RepID=UPI001BD96AEC|nr:efflux transporter outer membrane subunit [Curvibacter sp. CHRR-16]MBT0571641.1 efflux transporter outer membrane subunit [Curvibacter sp. CHRR-16]